MSDRSIKQLEKLMNHEAQRDEKNIHRAEKDLKRVEKAYNQSLREIEKAQHELEKASKDELKKAKIFHKAEAAYKDAVADKDKAEKMHMERSQAEDLERQDIQERYKQLDEAHTEFDQRSRQRADQSMELRTTHNGGITHENGL